MSAKLAVTLVKSMIGKPEKQRQVLRGMGLNKINQMVLLTNNAATRGMVNAVSHLVKAEEMNDEVK